MCDHHEDVEDDQGPWQVDVWRRPEGPLVVLQSHDFAHDVALVVNGDFACHEQVLQYANMLATRMNAMPGVRPLDWRKKRD